MPKLLDLTNKTFCYWTVIKRGKNTKKGSATWFCKCRCGLKKDVRSRHLISGGSKSCGCLISTDIKGKRFGKWTVIEKDFSKKKGNGFWWKCKCDCGINKSILRGSLTSGSSLTCGCWKQKSSKDTAIHSLFTNHKRHAKRRNKEFTLSKGLFEELILGKCFYCKSDHSNIFNVKELKFRKGKRVFKYNGIDRINNSLGYTKENTVSCCKVCNNGKGELDKDEWFKHIKKVLDNAQKL